jgi:hypothetical protein
MLTCTHAPAAYLGQGRPRGAAVLDQTRCKGAFVVVRHVGTWLDRNVSGWLVLG